MLPMLLVPILVSGIIWIKNRPKERAKISAYQGWVVYLYAAAYGVLAVFVSWVFLEFFLPFVFVEFGSFIYFSLKFTGIEFEVSADYLDKASMYLASKMSSGQVLEDKASAALSARLFILSIVSIFLTKMYCWGLWCFCKWTGIDKRQTVKVYRENSQIDYQMMRISSGAITYSKLEREYLEYRNSTAKRNRKTKLRLRKLVRFIDNGRDEDDEFSKEMKEKIRRTYKKIIRLEFEILREMKEDLKDGYLLAQVTLESRKVYIGIPKQFSFPDEHGVRSQEVVIYPRYSGYRRGKDLSIVLTNEYKELEESGAMEIDNVVIPISQVSSVSAFSMEQYNNIQDNMRKSFTYSKSGKYYRRYARKIFPLGG